MHVFSDLKLCPPCTGLKQGSERIWELVLVVLFGIYLFFSCEERSFGDESAVCPLWEDRLSHGESQLSGQGELLLLSTQ